MGRNAEGKFEILYLLKSRQLEEHTFLHGFPRTKAVCVCWRWQAKQKKMWTEWRNLFSQIEESLFVNLLWILFGSFQSTWKDNLNMHQNFSKFMPCLLSEEQKKNHVSCEFSGYKQNDCVSTPSLLITFTAIWFLPLAKTQYGFKGKEF
jgi:hypothetical protein